MLEIKNVYKAYEKNEVLHDINICVKQGEIHGLIGENSAGKTTLIKCVSGVYKPQKGEILYDSNPIFDNPDTKKRVGYVADYNDYIPSYTISKLVHMYEIFYEKFDKEKFNEMNKSFKLSVNKRISSLSKGQKMRLAFMLEISKQPDYLIMDEPTSGLDPIAKAKFFEILVDEVEKRNIGVLISSHNLDGLEKICDSVTMLVDGSVEKQMSMDDMKCQLVKLSAVFPNGVGAGLLTHEKIVKATNVGSIYTLIVRDYDDSVKNDIEKLGATFIEPVEISLEELFVALAAHGGE